MREDRGNILKRYLLRFLLVLLFSLGGGWFTYVLMISEWPEESSLVRLESLRYLSEEESPGSFQRYESAEELPEMPSLQKEEESFSEGWEVDRLEVVLKVLSGTERGTYLSVVLEQLRDGGVPLRKGRAYVLLADSFPEGEDQYYISDSFRAPWVVTFLFAALGGIMASAGMAGVRALAGLILSLGVFLYWYVPLLQHGVSPVPYALVVVFLIAAFTVVLVVRRRRWWPVAFLGSAGGALAAFLLGWSLVWLWQLTGLAGVGGALLSSILPHLSLRGILLASVIIGSIGAVLDVGISVTATMAELAAYDPQISPSRLWKSGIGAGREVLGSMINTLVLAYVGSALPFVLLVAESGISLMGFLNNPSIAEELVRSLAGTLGLLLTVPITAFLGMLWHGKNGENNKESSKEESEEANEQER